MSWFSAALGFADAHRISEQQERIERRYMTTKMIADETMAMIRDKYSVLYAPIQSIRPVAKTKRKKCPCCGSHEYTIKSGSSICSYCRIPEMEDICDQRVGTSIYSATLQEEC